MMEKTMKRFGSVTAWFMISLGTTAAAAGLVPADLRVEYRQDPLGVDVARPRLSWILQATDPNERGQRQTAYQVLVASSPELLRADKGDLWDSGKVASDQSIHVVYEGKPLGSRMFCHWKVRVWESGGKASGWSEPAKWSMGLLERSAWKAKWIGDDKDLVNAQIEAGASRTMHSGYRTGFAKSPDVRKWVAVDLGKPLRIDGVRLYPAQAYNWQPDGPSLYFPVRFRLEVANSAGFADAKTVADRTAEDYPQPGPGEPQLVRFAPVTARHVRLTITRLVQENELRSDAALAEMEVLSGDTNVARGAAVTALDSLDGPGWSKDYLVDGRTGPSAGEEVLLPALMLRKPFELSGKIRRATVYVTARGLYELRINGRRIGDHLLAPEWTSYLKRIQYQAYDVTGELRSGGNVIGALVGAGWYAGRIGLIQHRHIYGARPQLLLHLSVELADGRTETIASDGSWTMTTNGPIRSSDILDGELYDARKEMPGWDVPGFDAAAWRPVHSEEDLGDAKLVWQRNEPIRVVKELKPVKMTQPKPGVYVFDLGQNMVGWCRLKARGPAGTVLKLRHAEMLNDDGTIYTANLRSAPQIDRFVLRGQGDEVFEPHFTYHGFRYVELTGLPSAPAPDAILGRVFHSSSPDSGRFETSSALVNQLMSNIVWTQRGNMHSTPTDCPQRDERLGWMGDIQSFSQTAIFNMNMAGFFSKWIADVRDDQASDGRFPDFAPNPMTALKQDAFFGVPAWGDAGTIVPWRMYQNYADKRMIEEHFESARRWVDHIHGRNPNLLWENSRGNDYNDWLNADTLILAGWPKTGGMVPKPVFATAFFAHSTELVSKMAAVLGREEESKRYSTLFEQIKAAFNRAYVKPDGRIEGDTQAGYALALAFDLLPDDLRAKAAAHMIEGFRRYDGHLSTGIQASHRLMLALSRYGHLEEAYRLLNLRTFPSWGFMIENGATTIWERWDGYVKGRGFQNPGMNSFNHWALGAVGEWMWRNIIGINPDDDHPGYREFVLRSRPGGGLSWAKGAYDSIMGRIASEWRIEGGTFTWKIAVPPNTVATIYVPTKDAKSVKEDGKPAAEADGVRFVRVEDGAAVYRVGSGTYSFMAPY
jgi:alpha-L-rhamnosidase